MGKDYNVVRYIRKQTADFNDKKLTLAIQRAFDLIIKFQDHKGCLTSSIILYIALKELGYNPQICYGLCKTKNNFEFYHAWIELNNKVIDVAIYGNINFSPLTKEEPNIELPVVLEDYKDCCIEYGRFCFDADWDMAEIKTAENWTLTQYFQNAHTQQIYRVASSVLNEPIKANTVAIIEKYKNIKISDYKNKMKGV